jgi:hypothetical protein
MSHKLRIAVLGIGLAVSAAAAHATPIMAGSEKSLQTIIDELHIAGGAPDVNTYQLVNDQLWSIESSGTSAVNLVVEISGNSANNEFGIYDATNAKLVPLFLGSATATDRATVSVFADGSLLVSYTNGSGTTQQSYATSTLTGNLFGFYLSTVAGGSGGGSGSGVYFSETSRNLGNQDQMVAFRGDGDIIQLPGAFPGAWGSSSYLLAWEDQAYDSSDKDFNDLVVYIESVKPVPEPGTLALLALGMIGVGIAQRRRQTRA